MAYLSNSFPDAKGYRLFLFILWWGGSRGWPWSSASVLKEEIVWIWRSWAFNDRCSSSHASISPDVCFRGNEFVCSCILVTDDARGCGAVSFCVTGATFCAHFGSQVKKSMASAVFEELTLFRCYSVVKHAWDVVLRGVWVLCQHVLRFSSAAAMCSNCRTFSREFVVAFSSSTDVVFSVGLLLWGDVSGDFFSGAFVVGVPFCNSRNATKKSPRKVFKKTC